MKRRVRRKIKKEVMKWMKKKRTGRRIKTRGRKIRIQIRKWIKMGQEE